ncbi:MAG: ABC transporter permease [Clostridia bacterium]|nr:ABC transporter permease [Clostridia bacterium]
MKDITVLEMQKQELEEVKYRLKKEQRDLTIRKFLKNKLAVIGSLLVIAMILVAVLAPVIAPYDPLEPQGKKRLEPPSAEHIFGTDKMSRDVFSRVVYGTRVSMLVGVCVGASSMVVGMFLGLYAAYYKWLDNIIMRICDGLTAIPSTLLAIALMAILGSTAVNVIIAMSIVYTPRMARIARSSALVVKEQTYIEALRSQGAPAPLIIWRHMAPNILSTVVVQASYNFANSIITEAALSFLGVGIPAPQPSWGNILNEGRSAINTAWWMIIFPGIATAVAVMGINIFGDGLRDILDPRTNQH